VVVGLSNCCSNKVMGIAYNKANCVMRSGSKNSPHIPGKLATFRDHGCAKLRQRFNGLRLCISDAKEVWLCPCGGRNSR